MPLNLSDRQKNAIGTALTLLAAAVIIASIGLLFWAIGAFFQRFSNVFLPLAVAAVAALVFNPYFEWLRRRLHMPTAVAVAVVFLSALIPLTAFFWFFGALAVEQITELVKQVPAWWENVRAEIQRRLPEIQDFFQNNPWGQRIQSAVQNQQEAMLQGLSEVSSRAADFGAFVMRSIGTLLAWAVLPVYFAFFLIAEMQKPRNPEALLPFLKQETRRDVIYLVREFVNIIVAFFRGQLLVATFQGLLFAAGFSIVGLKYGFVLGLVLGFLNIIPYLGSIVGLGVALPLAYFQDDGGLLKVGLVLLVFTIVQMIEGYILTPKIMGDRTGLHPVAIIVAVFFWGSALGGISGMILAIPLTAFLVVFWRLAREKYIQEML
ncbi:MAG: AI-2E family transporter [Acidobacteriota bacterium]|nr:AI-2E family transporter [Acidobacteriota bacterium]